VTRTIFLSFTFAIILIGGVVAILTNFGDFSHRRTQPGSSVAAGLAVGIVVVSLASLAVSARIGGRIRVTPTTTPVDVAGYFRTRFFLRVAFSEACALLGFVGFIITVRWWMYLIGAVFTAVGFARLAPTAVNLRRDQETINETKPGLNLIASLRTTPPPPPSFQRGGWGAR
jgi:hypothetical protein